MSSIQVASRFRTAFPRDFRASSVLFYCSFWIPNGVVFDVFISGNNHFLAHPNILQTEKIVHVQVSRSAYCNFNAHIPFSRTKYLHIICGFYLPCGAIFESIKQRDARQTRRVSFRAPRALTFAAQTRCSQKCKYTS